LKNDTLLLSSMATKKVMLGHSFLLLSCELLSERRQELTVFSFFF